MSNNGTVRSINRKSKAAIAVDIQTDNRVVGDGLQLLCERAATILDTVAPTKRIRKSLLDTAESLLQLQGNIVKDIPTLILDDCTKYAIDRISREKAHETLTCVAALPPAHTTRLRTFDVGGVQIPLPFNRLQYTAVEACTILTTIQTDKRVSLNKVVAAMLNYRVSHGCVVTPLIPFDRSAMFRMLAKYKKDPNVEWKMRGVKPILDNNQFLEKVNLFEKDVCRAVGRNDIKMILKEAKVEYARKERSSTMIVTSPTMKSVNNYMNLLTQLDANRSITSTIQQKSEARYIAERSVRNAISHIMAVAVSHYTSGIPDSRLQPISKATTGAIKLYDLIQRENGGSELKVILPMFLSSTDDTTVFAFEGAVQGKQSDKFIIKKDDDTATRSSYTRNTSSTDSLCGLCIRHSVTFNAVGNAAPLYATVYGLSEEELPSAHCPSGRLCVPLPGFCYGGCQDASNSSVGYLVFLRSTNVEDDISTDQINHTKYRNDVFIPWVQNTRESYLRKEGWHPGDEVDTDHVWVGWQVHLNIVVLIYHRRLFIISILYTP